VLIGNTNLDVNLQVFVMHIWEPLLKQVFCLLKSIFPFFLWSWVSSSPRS